MSDEIFSILYDLDANNIFRERIQISKCQKIFQGKPNFISGYSGSIEVMVIAYMVPN